ncbi:MAG: endonuclease [Bacteroidota bacterium]|nr:endonuclease [Bacteroidota bacterium]
MPEGPSIYILKEETQQFKNKKILRIEGNTKVDHTHLEGKKILELKSWGKHFLLCFKNSFIRIHLLMFGSYRVNERRENPVRLSLRFKNGELNFYTCSVKYLEEDVYSFYDWSVDPMSEDWDPDYVYKLVRSNPDRMICDVLMDQEIFSGVGNIIKNEVLFLTRVHPEKLVRELKPKKIKEIIKTSCSYCFDFLKWKRAFVLRKHWLIYKAKVCPECAGAVTLRHTGKGKRRTFFCERCQVLK